MEYLYLPTKLKDIIMPNKDEILKKLLYHIDTENMNLLFIGSNNTFKTVIIELLAEEYYKRKGIHNKNLIMNIDCFMDITFSSTINEIKTFCKTTTHNKKMIIINNFDIINESNQQYLKIWMDNCKNTFFIFGCENTNKINEIIQTRITPIYLDDLNTNNYNEIILMISKKENIQIDNIDVLLKYKNITIYFIYNLFNKLKLLKKKHIKDITPYITLIDYTIFDNYFDLIKMNTLTNTLTNTNIKESIKILFDLYDKGYSLIDIYHFMYEYIKMSNNEHKYKIIEKLCLYIQYIYEGFDNKIMLMFYTNDLIIIYNNII
uniref:Replication factor C C-terminal domain-containing protein n=1 Tax=viral metagenome TaxID=1070528 RepID=A0A6C0ESA1_9ZZZZ